VRDHTVEELAARNQMPTRPIDAKPLRIGRRTIERQALQTLCCLQAAVIEETESGIAIVSVSVIAISSAILTGLTAAAERKYLVTMIESGGTGRAKERSSIVREEIPGEALMSCLMVTRDRVRVGDEELTVMWKVLMAQESQRFVVFPIVSTSHNGIIWNYGVSWIGSAHFPG